LWPLNFSRQPKCAPEPTTSALAFGNSLKKASDKEVSPESRGVGYGWVCAILKASPCQCRQYTNAEATWAYVGCKLVA
jgi:hypothetical protein